MIAFKDVFFSYDKTPVFEGLNLEINDTGITAVIAPSGIGKTTLLRLLSGLEHPSDGEVIGMSKKVSFVFQEHRLLPWCTVFENIKISTNAEDDTIKEMLLEFGIFDELQSRRPESLSGGQKQRVCLARALLYEGDILLLDEPFTGLDVENRQIVLKRIKEYSNNHPVVLVSHIEADIEIADYVINL